jgi:hypothetical protein
LNFLGKNIELCHENRQCFICDRSSLGFPNEFAVTGILKEVGGYVVLGLRASPCEGFEI